MYFSASAVSPLYLLIFTHTRACIARMFMNCPSAHTHSRVIRLGVAFAQLVNRNSLPTDFFILYHLHLFFAIHIFFLLYIHIGNNYIHNTIYTIHASYTFTCIILCTLHMCLIYMTSLHYTVIKVAIR